MSFNRYCNLLYVGRPVVEKGLPDLLRALLHLSELQWRLSIAGDVAPRTLLFDPLPARISLLGRLSQTRVARAMQSHDILVVPSRYETFGNVALEGLAVAMIVVAARVGGLKDLIAHGRTGFHFEAGDVSSLAATLGYVLTEFGGLGEIRRNARLEAMNYSWPEVAAATEKVLSSLI